MPMSGLEALLAAGQQRRAERQAERQRQTQLQISQEEIKARLQMAREDVAARERMLAKELNFRAEEGERQRQFEERLLKWKAMTEQEFFKERARIEYEYNLALQENNWERARELYKELDDANSFWNWFGDIIKGGGSMALGIGLGQALGAALI